MPACLHGLSHLLTAVHASAGVHVTLPDYYSPEHLGMIVPKTKDGRVVFMLPWLDATIAGTTGAHAQLYLLPVICMHLCYAIAE